MAPWEEYEKPPRNKGRNGFDQGRYASEAEQRPSACNGKNILRSQLAELLADRLSDVRRKLRQQARQFVRLLDKPFKERGAGEPWPDQSRQIEHRPAFAVTARKGFELGHSAADTALQA